MSTKITKVKARTWSFDKFAKAVTNRSKRLGVPIKAALLKKVYENGLTVKAALESCKTKKAA